MAGNSTGSSRSGGGSEVARIGKGSGDLEMFGDEELGPNGTGLGVPKSMCLRIYEKLKDWYSLDGPGVLSEAKESSVSLEVTVRSDRSLS